MWKLAVAFAVFAAIALYVISQAGDKVDMGGEKHGTESSAPAGSHSGAASAPAAAPGASAPAR